MKVSQVAVESLVAVQVLETPVPVIVTVKLPVPPAAGTVAPCGESITGGTSGGFISVRVSITFDAASVKSLQSSVSVDSCSGLMITSGGLLTLKKSFGYCWSSGVLGAAGGGMERHSRGSSASASAWLATTRGGMFHLKLT